MTNHSSIFKAYDIRGTENKDITEKFAQRLGEAFIFWLKKSNFIRGTHPTVVVSYDARLLSPALAKEVAHGAKNMGARVVLAGMTSTPMHYFLINHLAADGGIMVTASHNPVGQNGFKLCREKAIPVGQSSGLEEIRELMEKKEAFHPAEGGSVDSQDRAADYLAFLSADRKKSSLRIIFDCADGATGPIVKKLVENMGLSAEVIFGDPDGTFPHHDPNPLKPGALDKLLEKVKNTKADLGIAFDADGDRVFFVTPKQGFVDPDKIAMLLAEFEIKKASGGAVVLDLRMSRKVFQSVKEHSGVPIMSRVGHAFIKQTMRQQDALFGAELSGHYYFKEFFYADSGIFASLEMLDFLNVTQQTMDEATAKLPHYFKSEEKSFHVRNSVEVICDFQKMFSEGKQENVDGLTVHYPDWWFNLRASQTEPLIRLVLEADTQEILEEKMRLLSERILSYVD